MSHQLFLPKVKYTACEIDRRSNPHGLFIISDFISALNYNSYCNYQKKDFRQIPVLFFIAAGILTGEGKGRFVSPAEP
jgi:hypothetical protein